MMKELTLKQKLAIKRVLIGRAKIEEAKRSAELYVAIAIDTGVSVRRLADETGLTRSRIYQMRDAGRLYLDT
jgi:hypothetical protein